MGDVGVDSGSEPRGLKPAPFKASVGATEVVPFPIMVIAVLSAAPSGCYERPSFVKAAVRVR